MLDWLLSLIPAAVPKEAEFGCMMTAIIVMIALVAFLAWGSL